MRQSTLILIGKFMADLLAFALAFTFGFVAATGLTRLLRGIHYLSPDSSPVHNHMIIFSIFAVGVCAVLYGKGHYTQRLPWWHQVRQIIITLLIAMLLQGFLHYILKYPLSRLWVGLAWGSAIPLLILSRLVVRRILRKMGKWSAPTIIIGGIGNTLETAFALHSDTFADYNLRRIILLSDGIITKEQLPPRYKNVPVLVGMKAARANLSQAPKNTYIVLAADDSVSAPMNDLYNEIKTSRRNIGVVPPLNGFGIYNTSPRYFFGHNVMIFHPNLSDRNPLNRILKRELDIVASFLGLLLLSPLFLVIAVLIKVQSPGSRVFFKHVRVGQGGRPFKVYKFTSMVPNAQQVLERILKTDPAAKAEWERDFKLKNDPRIIPIGRILRATSLDELPQLWNVLKGHMSLVGPRPIVQDETRFYGPNLPAYLSIKPGLTGLWQVSGRNDTSYEYRVYLDTWYAKHWSFWHDVVILLETIKIVIKRSGAY